jgi:ribosomal protein RSM22 (predicted rRNA methylase)
MYFESKIFLSNNYSLEELRKILENAINKKNDIDNVLSEMKCISSILENEIKNDSIYAFKTANYYYLFYSEPGIIIAQIELKAYDRNLKSNIKSIFNTLKIVRTKLKENKKTKKDFTPLRLLDIEGGYTGVKFTMSSLKQAIFNGLKSPKYLELVGLTIAAYFFSLANLDDYLKSIKPTIIIGVIIYLVQVIQKTIDLLNKENVTVE